MTTIGVRLNSSIAEVDHVADEMDQSNLLAEEAPSSKTI